MRVIINGIEKFPRFCGECFLMSGETCECSVPGIERKPRNHFEQVKAMSMEEMAVWLAAIGPVPEAMLKFWRKWLKE